MKKNKSEGLGDSIDKITSATGIKAVVKFIAGDDCGCNDRQNTLNELFPYKRNTPNCLNEDEYKWLSEFFADESKFSYTVIKTKIGTIWARVFNMHYKKICNCKSSPLKRYVDELKQVYETYEKN